MGIMEVVIKSKEETVIVLAPAIQQGERLVTKEDVKYQLSHADVIPSSFFSSLVDLDLIPKSGVLIFPAGTPLNFDDDGDSILDSIRTVVSYNYQIRKPE